MNNLGVVQEFQKFYTQTPSELDFVYQAQSGSTDDNSIMKLSSETQQQNVQFSDQLTSYMYDVESTVDPTRKLQDSDDATLDNFFRRPIKIAEEEWSTSTALETDIDPWSLYFDNVRVSNRLANYNLLRADLHIKIVINGNGFQYGRAIVSYLPFDVYDTLSSNAALIRSDLVQASQQPHVYLDPTTSTGGEMKLPFFNYLNYCNIPNSQWSEMGQLYFRTLNDLKHANGATDVVTISVFAWAENVSLSVLTAVEPDTLEPQSGEETDQANMKGFVSGPATAVAKVASALSNVPMIGPFAQATEMAANTTGSIAKMFGYCRPPVTKAPEPYRPTITSSLALTNAPDVLQKMTVDDKQQLTVDPRISGLNGVDSLNIKEIAKRESYLTTFTWAIGDTPETLLWNGRIDPVTWAEETGPPVSFHFPACAMAALPFQYWTGTMKFRFQIVCSAFHKGRLKVVYDPNYLASNEYNTNYLRVIDIADQTDFTIEIGNGQDKTLLDHHNPGVDSVTQMYSTTAYASKEEGNGVVGVYIVNELTTPNSTTNNDIEVNVFVSMGDDFEVFVPTDEFQNFVFKPQSGEEFSPQSGEIVTEAQNTAEPSAPQQEMSMDLGPEIQDTSNVNHVFTGEAISSFRTMLKRYNLWKTLGTAATGDLILTGRHPMYPYLRGNVGGAVDVDAGANAYNYVNTVLLHWVRSAFSGWRGSIRYKIVPRAQHSVNDTIYVSRTPLVGGNASYSESVQTLATFTSLSEVHHNAVKNVASFGLREANTMPTGTPGSAFTQAMINPSLEFEMPFYSTTRFTPGKEQDLTTTMVWNECWDYRITQTNPNTSAIFDIHCAVGEDFQAYFWTGMPRMYYEANPPAAV